MNAKLIEALAKVAEVDEYVIISTQDAVDELIKKKMTDLDFIVIEAMEDPIFMFWQLVKAKVLASSCHVVFLDINLRLPGWVSLRTDYEGVRFGSTFLLYCDTAHTTPRIVPSQRGIFRNP